MRETKSSLMQFQNCKLKVGLLGGSFNPAHAGHLHISKVIHKTLGLDQIWWLVSPQNPLKSSNNMSPFQERYAFAKKLVKLNFIKVTDIEKNINSNYTIDVIRKLQIKFPRIKFVWIMGADNLFQIAKWYRWQDIFQLVPIVVYDRDPFSYKALRSKAALAYRRFRINTKLHKLPENLPPSWCYLRLRKHPLSSTKLRSMTVDNN